MQSNNPVFRRSEEFHAGGTNAYGNQTYAGNGSTYQGYGADPSTWGTGTPGENAPAGSKAASATTTSSPKAARRNSPIITRMWLLYCRL